MSTTNATTFNFTIYQTNNNGPAGTGTMILSGPDSHGMVSAQITKLVINGKSISPEEIKGPSSGCSGTLTSQLYTSQNNDIKMFLAQNPLESRVSYAGSMTYLSGVYNLSAVVA